jgi:hypothetical protein
MIVKRILGLMVMALLVLGLSAACAPAAEEEIGEVAYPASEEMELAVDTYPNNAEGNAAESQGKPVETPPGVVVVAPSGSVDLSKLTPEPPSGEEILEEMPEPGRPGDPLPAELNQMVLVLVEHLAEYADVSPLDVQSVSAEAVTWGNTALGCPEPDTAYAEVLVEGWQVTLKAEGKTYMYHTDRLARFVLCEDGLPAAEGEIQS